MIIKHNHALKRLNTFGLSVVAERFSEVFTVEDIQLLLQTEIEPIHILGGGSNLLLTRDLAGLVIKNEIKGFEIIQEDANSVVVAFGGGENWHQVVLWALEHNFGGIENLSLIPGSVGAAPIQNIGAYGVELKDVFEKLEAVEIPSGKLGIFHKKECGFGYRDSVFKGPLKGKYFITKVFLRLTKKEHALNMEYGAIQQVLSEQGVTNPTIKDVSNAVIYIRKSKLPDPDQIGNSGSFFKNPEIETAEFHRLIKAFPDLVYYKLPNGKVKIPAGWLIERAGWKGKRIGDAGTHSRQALVLVNHGNASGQEILHLSRQILAEIQEQFGISLELEVNVW